MCGSASDLVADVKRQSRYFVIPSSTYSCEYKISVPSLTYRTSSSILVWLEEIWYAQVYIYSGTGHTNLTLEIENNKTATKGAPVRIPVDN